MLTSDASCISTQNIGTVHIHLWYFVHVHDVKCHYYRVHDGTIPSSVNKKVVSPRKSLKVYRIILSACLYCTVTHFTHTINYSTKLCISTHKQETIDDIFPNEAIRFKAVTNVMPGVFNNNFNVY